MRSTFLIALLVGSLTGLLGGCAAASGRQHHPPTTSTPPLKNKEAQAGGRIGGVSNDDLDEYSVVVIADPLEPVNRGTFWVNHQLYKFILRPVSKIYDTLLPKKLRTAVYNVFDNVEFPIRVVNNALQGNFSRAAQETEKFAVNTIGGIGGFFRLSDRFPSLANVPPADTAQTFAKWGIGNGFYFVIPVLGPSTLRDTVGLAGDYALDPVTWVSIYFVKYSWTLAVSSPDTARAIPIKLGKYDAAIKDSVDRYLAARSAYIQNRNQAVLK